MRSRRSVPWVVSSPEAVSFVPEFVDVAFRLLFTRPFGFVLKKQMKVMMKSLHWGHGFMVGLSAHFTIVKNLPGN